MKIIKFGHSCVLLDDGQTKLLFDPGSYSEIPNVSVDAIVITHVHQDHLDISKIHAVLANNPNAKIYTNTQSCEELIKNGLTAEIVEQGQTAQIGTFSIEGYGNEHAIMHPDLPKFQNTSYLINGNIFHPGDSLLTIDKPVDILLLPISAPWSKVSETLDYITAVNPKVCFPIHDGFLAGGGAFYRLSKMWCEKLEVQFIEPELNKEYAF